MERAEIANNISDSQKSFYEENKKNMFFKKSQKFECAAQVCQTNNLADLLAAAIFRPAGGPKVVLDYTLLKTFAHPEIFGQIVRYGFDEIRAAIAEHNHYEVHINLYGYTVSAMERFQPLVETFFAAMDPADTSFFSYLRRVVIYNPPSIFSMLHKFVMKFITSNTSQIETTLLDKKDNAEELFRQIVTAY